MQYNPEDALVVFGGAVKALGDGKVGGYLVVFGDETRTDTSPMRDFFTKDTDYGPHTTSPVYYHHGRDKVLKRRELDTDATLKADDVGVWVEAQLDTSDRYAAAVVKLAEAGKLGWSSGTAPHLVERERKANGANWIKKWPLGLDASLTPCPAEPRAQAVALKSLEAGPALDELVPELKDAEGDADGVQRQEAQEGPVTPADETKDLTLNQVSDKVDDAVCDAIFGPRKRDGSGAMECRWVNTHVFRDYVIYEKPDGGGYFRRSYMIDPRGKVTLGETEQPVEQTWQPVAAATKDAEEYVFSLGESTFETHTKSVLAAVKGWNTRMAGIKALREEKAGRVLSEMNRGRLASMRQAVGEAMETIQSALADLEALLADTEPKKPGGEDDEGMTKALLDLRRQALQAEVRHREILR